MKTIVRDKIFSLGFTLGILIFITFNYLNYLHNVCSDTVDDCGWSFGFPFHFYSEGGFFTFREIIWSGLIANILFALIASLLIGLVFNYFGLKIKLR